MGAECEFVRLKARSRTEAAPEQHALSRWLLVVTACCTLACAATAGLIGWRPEWFWQPGQPWLAWIVGAGLSLLALAASIGWLADGSIARPFLVAVGPA